MDNRGYDIFPAVVKKSVAKVVSTVLTLLLVSQLTQLYTSRNVGVFFVIVAVSFTLAQIPSGFGKAVQKYTAEDNSKSFEYSVFLFAGLVAYAGVLVCVSWIVSFLTPLKIGGIIVTDLIVFAGSVGGVLRGVSVASNKFISGISRFVYSEVVANIVPLASAVVIVSVVNVFSLTVSVEVLFILSQIPRMFSGIASLYVGYTNGACENHLSREDAYSVCVFAFWSVPGDILNDFYHRIDSFILGILLSAVMVGYYEVSVRLMSFAFVFPATTSTVLLSKVSELVESGEEHVNDVIRTLVAIATVLSAISLAVFAVGEPILTVVYGVEYKNAYRLFVGLSVILVFQGVRMCLEAVFNALERPAIIPKVAGASIPLNIVVAVSLIPHIGAVGMIIGTLAAELFRVVVLGVLYSREV